jgi:topoisomerase-4 subunit A
MIVLEKWDPKKPLTAIYWEGEKVLFYVKRFMIEHPEKEEYIISDHPKSYLERIFTSHRPVAEVVFVKERGKDRKDNIEVDLEEFISVKGISAMGNQLTKDKVLEINALDPLPYEAPEPVPAADIDVVEEETVAPAESPSEETPGEKPAKPSKPPTDPDEEPPVGDDGQATLF